MADSSSTPTPAAVLDGRVSKPEAAVFVSGVASMGLEILAGRIVAPQFGSSIYTWGTIIGVFLAALSAGYHRGGKLATEEATERRLARLLLGTAVWVALLVFAGDLLLRSTVAFPLPSRVASLPAVVLLFGPPTYLLGFISPYGAELSRKEGLGRASGHVYAVGTIGSIVGAFGTTYFLIPGLGVDAIGLVFGLLLVATAAFLLFPSPSRDSILAVVGVLVVLVAAFSSGAAGVAPEGQVVYQTQTPYQQLEVIDSGDTRTLYLDGQRHSAMDLSNPDRHVFSYTRYFHLPYLFADDPDDIDRVLFIGGGGFTGPKRFVEEYDATVDVVEIDPEVIDVAKQYFDVEESEQLRIHNDDGRRYLRNTNETYDLIVLDAYKKDKVPFQLTTKEFMELSNDRLSDDGMVFANVISAPSGPASRFYRAEYATMNAVYPTVYSFPTAGGGVIQNIEMVATKNATVVTEETLRERNERRDIGIDLSAEIGDYRTEENVGDAPVLRDDYAPVDSLLDPMVGQRYVIDEAGSVENASAGSEGDGGDPEDGGAPENGGDRQRVSPVRLESGPAEPALPLAD
ncbi:Spermidine synthase [Halopenitus malekzadehii]|uniref:Polyamine aminopropyltransferase n=1 Tax=Halopenitus malekzadehii TaxID=1267564 RepID=A0A1H6ICP6_9EURY|nr:fused MFS/spermidine synthase [Halopenitus malekzadehii]SEH46575.1 Spermidine synthase [Halopenitus malekzadehii]